MLITRARTRASARGRRLLAGSQAGFAGSSAQGAAKMLHHYSTKAQFVSFHATQPQVQGRLHHVYPRGLRAATPVTL